jgi:hypothetical protein
VKTGGPPEPPLVTIHVAKVLTLSAISMLCAERIASGVATYSVGHQARISVTFAAPKMAQSLPPHSIMVFHYHLNQNVDYGPNLISRHPISALPYTV